MIEPLAADHTYTPELRERILAGFRGEVPPLRPSWTYRLTLAAVACVMVLLPVFYVGLIAGGLWLLWAYARFLFGSFLPENPGAGMTFFGFLPLFAGSVVVVCLVKPLFARPARAETPVRLTPEKEPLLFQFVARLCESLHAPVPREIRVDCQVNASASFRRGLLSLFDDDLVLTLGLPIVAGLSLQQLAGVMAHELGHFSQRAGLRVSVVIRIINFWFFRIVYLRDRLDAALERMAERTRFPWIRSYFRITLFLVKMTRRVLWALMMLGHMVSSYLMKQMEYDADRYEVRLAGFNSFDVTMREMFALNVAHDVSMEDLQNQWKEKRLVDNFPRLVVLNRREWVRQIAPQLENYLRSEPEGIFDTHPTARQRTAQALREKGVGVFTSDLPATALFFDFDALARDVSLHFYQEMVGNQVQAKNLVPLQKVRESQAQEDSERSALERFFQNPDWLRGLPLPQKLPALPPDPKIVVSELEKARHGVLSKDADHTSEIRSFRDGASRRIDCLQVRALLDAGFRIRPEELGLSNADPVTASMEADRAEAEMRSSASRLERYEKLEVRRLGLSLVLLEAPQVASRIKEADAWRQEFPPLLACAAFLSGKFPRLLELKTTRLVLDALVAQISEQPDPQLFRVITDRMNTLQDQLKELHRELRGQPYPFDHAREGINLAQVAIPSMPNSGDLPGLASMAGHALDRLLEIYARLLGRMAWMAEKVEEALGMPPLTKSAAPASSTANPEAVAMAGPAAAPTAPGALTATIQESKAEAVESRETFPRYFRGVLELRPLPLPEIVEAAPDVRAFLGALRESLQAVVTGAEGYTRSVRQYRDAEQRLAKAVQAERLLIAGVSIAAESFGLSGDDRAAATAARRRAEGEMEALEPGLRSFEGIQGRRLACALMLLRDDRVAARVPEGPRRRDEIAPLLASAAALQRHLPQFRELRLTSWGLRGLAVAPSGTSGEPLRDQVKEQMIRAHQQLQELQRLLHREPSPFVPTRGPASLAQVAIPTLPLNTDYDGIFQAVHFALREINDLHQRILGRLAGMAEKVEQALELRAA